MYMIHSSTFVDQHLNVGLHVVRLIRMVPTIVNAYKFCASRDTRIFYGWFLLIQGYFCAVQNYAEKAELSK